MLKSYFYITLLTLFTGCIALEVKKLLVPSIMQLGQKDSVILDCEYDFLDDSNGLVVKWFVDQSNLVYQWIADPSGNPPQDLGVLSGKIDLGYTASTDPLHAHRAIRILNPTVDMSGNYTCVVSTFASEDSKTKSMLVYNIVSDNIQLTFETVGDFVRLLCTVKDVYPKPIITMMANSQPLNVTSNSTSVEGLYDVKAVAELSASDVADGTELQCRVTLAQNNHTEAKYVAYYPGADSTAHLAAVEAGVAQRPFGAASRPLYSLMFTALLATMSLVRTATY